MANMSYCRFQNTFQDLRDCNEHLYDDLTDEEARARERLVKLCQQIAFEAEEILELEDEEPS